MRHYLDNSGSDISIDALDMVKKSVNGSKLFASEAQAAKTFAESLDPRKEYDITSSLHVTPMNEQESSLDWFLAVGGYSAWGKGHLMTGGYKTPYSDKRCFNLEFEYKVKDLYNFDEGKKVDFSIAGQKNTIDDEIMREFAIQGLAKTFFMSGSFKRTFEWKSGENIYPARTLLNGNK